MNCFKDRNGDQWTLDINVGSARRVKAETGFDILNALAFENGSARLDGIDALSVDVELLVNVLYSLCKSQAEKKGITPDGFAELFDGESVECATDSLIREIINFSQPLKRRTLLLIYEKMTSFRAKMAKEMEKKLESDELEEELERRLSEQFTNTQDALE